MRKQTIIEKKTGKMYYGVSTTPIKAFFKDGVEHVHFHFKLETGNTIECHSDYWELVDGDLRECPHLNKMRKVLKITDESKFCQIIKTLKFEGKIKQNH